MQRSVCLVGVCFGCRYDRNMVQTRTGGNQEGEQMYVTPRHGCSASERELAATNAVAKDETARYLQ